MNEKNEDNKKQDFLKAIFNVKQYTKNLKKNASNLQDDHYAAIYSYDKIQTYSVIPTSTKQSSTTFIAKDIYASTNLLFENSQSGNKKYKHKKTNNDQIIRDMTQSSSEIAYGKIKKSSYSQLQKTFGGSKNQQKRQNESFKIKQHEIQSQYKQKNTNYLIQQPLSGNTNNKTQSLSKIVHKQSLKNSNVHNYNNDYESEKLSLYQNTSQRGNRKNSIFYQNHKKTLPEKHSQKPGKQTSQYNLSIKNFMYLIDKVKQLQSIITLYQQSMIEMKKKILEIKVNEKECSMLQIFIDSLKTQLIQEKNKNAQLKEKIILHENHMKKHDTIIFEAVQKIHKFYEKQVSQVISLRKQNQFLKFLLRLQNPENSENLSTKIILTSNIVQTEQFKNKINAKNNSDEIINETFKFQLLSTDLQQLKQKSRINSTNKQLT